MTSTQWIGVAILALVFAFVAFAARQGTKVKPDRNNRDNWTYDPPHHGGPPDSHQ
jgi:hypothetical protein